MENYCSALLNQEKSLEELQRHLRNTEELFRESVKRKNQQLDLLQSEVRRLKTSVAGRDEQANAQMESALGAQAAELRRAKEALITRDADVEHLTKQLEAVKMELAIERSRREQDNERAMSASDAQGELKKRDEELEGVRLQLAQAQKAASRLQAASTEATAALAARESELEALRKNQEQAGVNTSAERTMLNKELQLLRAKCDELEAKLSKTETAHAEAEAWASELEAQRDGLQQQVEQLAAQLIEAKEAAAAAEEKLRASAERAAKQPSARVAEGHASSASRPPPEPVDSSPGVSSSLRTAAGASDDLGRSRGVTDNLGRSRGVAEDQGRSGGTTEDASRSRSSSQTAEVRTAAPSRSGDKTPSESTSRRTRQPSESEAPKTEAPNIEPTSSEPAVRSLVVGGNPIMGDSLSAEASFIGADFTSSTFAWYRGQVQLPSTGPSYMTSAEDVGHEIYVIVTPVGPNRKQGKPERATSSAPVAVAADIHMRVGEWIQMGQRRFDGCMEGDKERVLLLDYNKLKIRDKSGKTLIKDMHSVVRIQLAQDPLGFLLVMPSKKGGGALTLRAPNSMLRNLIYLTICAFRDPHVLDSWPIAPVSTPSGVLDLATLVGQGGTGNPDSPASSFTSEQPSMADVQDAERRSGISKVGRAFSFGRSKKK